MGYMSLELLAHVTEFAQSLANGIDRSTPFKGTKFENVAEVALLATKSFEQLSQTYNVLNQVYLFSKSIGSKIVRVIENQFITKKGDHQKSQFFDEADHGIPPYKEWEAEYSLKDTPEAKDLHKKYRDASYKTYLEHKRYEAANRNIALAIFDLQNQYNEAANNIGMQLEIIKGTETIATDASNEILDNVVNRVTGISQKLNETSNTTVLIQKCEETKQIAHEALLRFKAAEKEEQELYEQLLKMQVAFEVHEKYQQQPPELPKIDNFELYGNYVGGFSHGEPDSEDDDAETEEFLKNYMIENDEDFQNLKASFSEITL